MSIIKSALRELRREIDEYNRPKEAEKWVEIIAGYFDDNTLTGPQIDLAIGIVLSSTAEGSLILLHKCLNPTKDFRKASAALLKLYLHLVKSFTDKTRQYSGLNAAAKFVVTHENAKATEKELAIQIIREMVERQLLAEDQFKPLLSDLLGRLSVKLTDRFARLLYQTIGLIFRSYPQHVSQRQVLDFRTSMLTILENFVNKGNLISFLCSSGALDGLRYCFVNYPPDTDAEPAVICRVYKIMKKFCQQQKIAKNISESSLRFFKAHTSLFGRLIVEDAREWHYLFVQWFKTIAPDEKEYVVPAVYAFYGQVAATLTEKIDMTEEAKRELLELFLGHFKESLLDVNSKPFQIRLAILSFGILSGTVKRYLPPDTVTDLVNIVIANTNFAYFSELADKRDKIEHLPDFIQALSLLIEHVDGITSVQLASLEKFVQALLHDFQYLAAYHHPMVIRSLLNTFQACSKLGGTTVEDLLQRVMLQGILWACSHKLPLDMYQDGELDWKQNITYRNYLPLWKGLVLDIEKCPPELRPVKLLVGDTFFKCLLIMLKKLDLSTTKRKFLDGDGTESELFFCDPDSDLVPEKGSDFQIFFNLVSFYGEVLSKAAKDDLKYHLSTWFPVIVEQLILKCYEFPLISGFMKLLELFFRMAYRTVESVEELLLENDLKRNVVDFFKVIMDKAKGSSGELQLVSLKLIFKAPDGIIQEFVHELGDIFEIGFSIGKSVLWLAENALACLERNVERWSPSDKDTMLRRVLPLFDNFLLSKSDMNTDVNEKEAAGKDNNTKRRRRIIVVPNDLPEEDRDLRRVQKRIVLFLGTLEPEQCLYLIDSKANMANLTKWDINRNVKLPLYCDDKDIRPEMLLDNLMPRVFHLARTATDRQTKVAACELVHGITLYVIRSGDLNSRRFWKEIYRTMIELGCDPDTAVQQIFEPLLVQVMHYRALQWDNDKGSNEVLLEVIMDCLSDAKDPALRDMAAKSLRELISWSKDQVTYPNRISPIVQDILQRINFNSVDYNVDRRLGAALAFNNIYRILRKSEGVIEKYWLMLLYSFSTSLWLCDQGERAYGIEKLIEQVDNSLDHVLRVIVERPQLLKKSDKDKDRLKPEVFTEANLNGALVYLFQLAASKNWTIRDKSQSMFLKICLAEYSNPDSFLRQHHTEQSLINVCEEKLIGLVLVDWSSSGEQTVDFLQELLGSVGMYSFLFGGCHLNVAMKKQMLGHSVIFEALKRFLDLITNEVLNVEFSIQSKHRINVVSGKVIGEMLTFLFVASQEETPEIVLFLNSNSAAMVNIVTVICFEDHQKDFPLEHKSLKKRITGWIDRMRLNSWIRPFFVEMLKNISRRVDSEITNLESTLETVLNRDVIPKREFAEINGMLISKKFIMDSGHLSPELRGLGDKLSSRGLQLANILFGCAKETTNLNSIKPEVKTYANLVIGFCLKGHYSTQTLDFVVASLTNQQPISLGNGKGTATVGQLFRNLFREPLFEYAVSGSAMDDQANICRRLLEQVNGTNIKDILDVVKDLTTYLFKFYSGQIAIRQFIGDELILSWPSMFSIALTKADSVVLIHEFVSHVGLVTPGELCSIGAKLPGFDQWLFGVLQNRESTSDVKCKMISLLPIITGPTSDEQQPNLDRVLFSFKSNNIPLESNEFKANSLERAKFGVLLKTILDSLKISKSLTLFKFVIGITVPEKLHMMETEIRRTVTQLTCSMDSGMQLKFLECSFAIFEDNDDPPEPLVRLNLFRKFIKTMIRACSKETLLSFFTAKIQVIWNLTKADYKLVESEFNYIRIEHRLVDRIVGFYLLELMYGSLNVADMSGVSKGTFLEKNMLQDISKKCFEATKETYQVSLELINELFRIYQCGAYRALCTIVMTTKTDLKFYNKLVFPNHIWPRIISSKADVFKADLVVDFADFPKVKERMVSMKADATAIDGDGNKFHTLNTVFSSSLSQDVTNIDFTSRDLAANNRGDTTGNKSVDLEDLVMNNHELMPTLCAVIQHLFAKKITSSTTPEWVTTLATLMRSNDVHKNIRLFIGRLVENCKDLLQEHASTLFEPVLKLIFDECAGTILNVYYMDMIQMLIQWNVHYKPSSPEEKLLVADTIRFVVKRCYNESSDAMKLNLDLLKILVTIWKDIVYSATPKIIASELVVNSPASAYCNLQIDAIFLINDLTPWQRDSKLEYLAKLRAHLKDESMTTYKTAAQVLGYYLAIEGATDEVDSDYLRNIARKDPKQFVDILYGIHLKYPAIVQPFTDAILNLIPSALKTMKIKCLTILLAHTVSHKEIVAMGLLDLLKQREYQLYVLHVINKSLIEFSVEEKNSFLEHILAVTKSGKPQSKLVAFEILFKMYQTPAIGRKSDITFAIIHGFRDRDECVQTRLLNFWSEEANLPTELALRFPIAIDLFAGVTDLDDFLEFNTQLLLAVLIKNKNASRQIFTYETEYDNKLLEYEINVNWKSQNLSRTTPLFSRSLNTDFVPGKSTLTFKADTQDGYQFSPTLNPSAIESSSGIFTLPTQSSFLFTANGTQQLNGNSQTVLTESQQVGVPNNPLKKRLIRDKDKIARNVAVKAIHKRGFEEQRKLYARRNEQGKVTIYRRYRFGDFPDFLINHLALLLPLQALAKRDQLIARKVFVGIFQSLTDSFAEPERIVFFSHINTSINTALKDLKYCNSNVYGSLLELCFYAPRHLHLDVTGTISIHNNTPALAALVLENKIIHFDDSQHGGPMPKRRAGGPRTEEHALWMRVAELYRATQDSAIVSGIFAEKLDSDSKLIQAIEFESNGQFQKAFAGYSEILESVHRQERDYCYEALFHCYLEMGMWEESVQEVKRQMGDWDQLWTDEWNRENLLPNLIHSQLKLLLDEPQQEKQQFMLILNSWMQDKDRQRDLKLDFPEEMVMFNIISKKHLAARVLTEENIWSFANEWGHLSVLSGNVRRQRLLDIRIIAEIDSYLEILTSDNVNQSSSAVAVAKRWSTSYPRKNDSLLMWDFLGSCRRFIGNQLHPDKLDELQKVYFHMQNNVFRLAVAQRNIVFAEKVLSKMLVFSTKKKCAHTFIDLKCEMAQASITILRAELGEKEHKSQSSKVALKNLMQLDKSHLNLNSEFQLPIVLETVDLVERAYRSINYGQASTDELLRLIPGSTHHNFDDAVHHYILSTLRETIQLTKDFPTNFLGSRQSDAQRDIHVKLVQYCLDFLNRRPNVDANDEAELHELIVISLFESLRYGSEVGQKLFPSILRFKKEPYLQKLFVEKSRLVPIRLFLRWIPQLLSHLNFVKESYLDDLLLRIATEYPMALYFPFSLSYEQQKFQNSSSVDRSTVAAIKSAIYNPKMEMLVKGLSSVCLPQVMFVAHITNLVRTLKIKKSEFKGTLERTIAILSPDDGLLRGTLYRTMDKVVKKLEDLLRLDVSDGDQEGLMKNALEEIKKTLGTSQSRTSTAALDELCPWLAAYNSVHGDSLEIPGQYADLSGWTPNKESVKIMKFSQRIDVFESKTRPIRINIYGSDGHQHGFLLKYGEDLRQDQRIQQTFKLMSENLAMDKESRAMDLNIETYNVIPITSYFGMLSWVQDTVPMREFVENSLVYGAESMRGVLGKIQMDYNRFLQTHSDAKNICERYSDTAEKASLSQLRDKFRELSNKLPVDLLRQAIIEISASPESFYMLRNNFCRSMAAMNIAHWILGVGDRHLQNVLLNVKTCTLIGIDFNVVFESGFRVLPIPELIPFRMTPQFVNVMNPFGVTGAIKSAMTHSLRVFRAERKLLTTLLEVFLREPTIDWLYNAIFVQDDPAEFNTLSTDTRVHWDPSDRLLAVKEKLKGANPVALILNGLRMGNLSANPQVMDAYSAILQGARNCVRANLPTGGGGLSVEEQVQCLIDLATDPAVLGITFYGIFPWL